MFVQLAFQRSIQLLAMVLSMVALARGQDLNNNCILDSVEIAQDPLLDVAHVSPLFGPGPDGILDEVQGILPTLGDYDMYGPGDVPLASLVNSPNGSVDPDSVVVVTGPSHGSTVTFPAFGYVRTPSYSGISDTFTYRVAVCIGGCGTTTPVWLYSRPASVHVHLSPFPDCNGNGQDDTTEGGGCNFNGIPDSCEIAADPSLDCDGDGALDSCQIINNQSLDANSNGVLDTCENLVMSLNGSTQWVYAPNSASVALNQMTLECWINPTNFSARRTLISRWGDQGVNDRSYLVAIETGGAIQFSLSRADNQQDSSFQLFSAGQLVAGQWQHVACTYDGFMRRIFVNGVLAGQRATSGTINPGTMPLSVGAHLANQQGSGTVVEFALGSMDEVRIWSYARTESQIRGTVDERIKSGTLYPGLRATWNLDGNAIAPTLDGTLLYGAPAFTGAILPQLWSGLAAPAVATTTSLVSGYGAGFASNDVAAEAMLSSGGRYVAFRSSATDLFPGDTNMLTDVFRRDLATNSLIRISVGPGGVQGRISREPSPGQFVNSSHAVAIDTTARHVAFVSSFDNLVACDTNRAPDVFVNDLTHAVVSRVSVSSSGVQANGASGGVAISPGGRYVAFSSVASNLVSGDTNSATDVFLRDTVANTTALVSVRSDGVQATGSSVNASVSDTGRFVAFESTASNLVTGDTNNVSDVFVRDLQTNTTERVSVTAAGAQANAASIAPAISGDGRFVAFLSAATNLDGVDLNPQTDVFVHDRTTGSTLRVSQSTGGIYANGTCNSVSISLDGRYVAFASNATNLVPRDSNNAYDVFVRDILIGETRRISQSSAGLQGNLDSKVWSIATAPLRVGFTSLSTSLTSGVNSIDGQVYVSERPDPAPVAFCFGTAAACPCGNGGAVGHGCENSFATGGAILSATGSAIVSSDSLILTVAGLPSTNQAPTFFQGTALQNGGAGSAFGDGLRCAGGTTLRLGTRIATNGMVSLGFGIGGDLPVSVKGAVPMLGGMRVYQVIYRNVQPFCSPSAFNLSNGISVTWAP